MDKPPAHGKGKTAHGKGKTARAKHGKQKPALKSAQY
jgi:hypothetical protein